MNVLQICPHYYPATQFGGVVQVAHSISKELIRQGHNVCICTTNLQDHTHDLTLPTDTQVLVDGARVFYEPVIISRYWGFSLALAKRIFIECDRADIIFVHFHYQFASVIGGFISRLKKKPYIVFTHGSLNRYGIDRQSRFRKLIYLLLAERRNFTHAKFVAYHSIEELDNSLVMGTPYIVPNGIEVHDALTLPAKGMFRSQHPGFDTALIYLYLGRLAPGKGLDLLIHAFKDLLVSHPEARLVLAGSDEKGYGTVLHRLVQEYDLSKEVLFTGFVSGTSKLSILQDADIYVLPSSSEGVSMAMLEAMATGIPVIVSDRVGLYRTIQAEECGIVVSQKREHLLQALQILADSDDRIQVGRRGQTLVSHKFTWPVIIKDLMFKLVDYA